MAVGAAAAGGGQPVAAHPHALLAGGAAGVHARRPSAGRQRPGGSRAPGGAYGGARRV